MNQSALRSLVAQWRADVSPEAERRRSDSQYSDGRDDSLERCANELEEALSETPKALVLMFYPMSVEDDDGTGAQALAVGSDVDALIEFAHKKDSADFADSGEEFSHRVLIDPDGAPGATIQRDVNGDGDFLTYYDIQEADVIG